MLCLSSKNVSNPKSNIQLLFSNVQSTVLNGGNDVNKPASDPFLCDL